jgi:hypothetical protein
MLIRTPDIAMPTIPLRQARSACTSSPRDCGLLPFAAALALTVGSS